MYRSKLPNDEEKGAEFGPTSYRAGSSSSWMVKIAFTRMCRHFQMFLLKPLKSNKSLYSHGYFAAAVKTLHKPRPPYLLRKPFFPHLRMLRLPRGVGLDSVNIIIRCLTTSPRDQFKLQSVQTIKHFLVDFKQMLLFC